MCKAVFIFSCLWIIFSANAGKLRDDLLFWVSFDRNCDADFAKGSPKAKIYGKVELKRGRNGGKCALFRKKGDYISYPLKGNMNLPQGAIMLWVYELDTPPKQRVWNPFFQMRSKDEVLNILRFWQPMRYGGGIWRKGVKGTLLGLGAAPIPGEKKNVLPAKRWFQLIFTWRQHAAAIYLNGKPYDHANNIDFNIPAATVFSLGRILKPTCNADSHHTGEHLLKDAPDIARKMKIGTEPYGAYLLDEVAVFNRYLGPSEAAALFNKGLKQALSSEVKGQGKMSVRNFISQKKVQVDLDFGCRMPVGTTAEVWIEGSSVKQKTKLKKGGFDYVFLDVKKLPPGKYSIIAKIVGKTIAPKLKAPFEKLDMRNEAWLNNTYGKADVVLPGFEPLSTEDKKVKLWGRSYDFSSGPMPGQIINQKIKMLKRPINWFVKVNGKVQALKMDSFELLESKDTRARFKGKGTLGPLNVSAEVMVEYDGFMKFDLTFSPKGNTSVVEKLYMDIPLVPKQSPLMLYHCRLRALWDDKWESALKLPRYGVITLGTPDIILQWMTESDQYYYPRDSKQQLQTFTLNGAHVFRTNVIGAKKQIKSPFKLTFALQAGPVKARPKKWRGWTMKGRPYLDPEKHKDVQYKYFQGWWSRTPGSVIPRTGYDAEMLKDRIDGTSLHFAGFRHFKAKNINEVLPEWEKYREEWERVPRKNVEMGKAPGWNNTYVDTNSSWAQWHVYNVYQLFSKSKMRGLYYDDWRPGVSRNQAAGSGYVDENGIRRPTYPLFSQREIHRRVYAIIKKFRPDDGIVIIHTSGLQALPIIAFCDIIYDGEILGWLQYRPRKGNYFDSYHLDLLQMLFSGKQYGPVFSFHDMTRTYVDRNVKDMGCIMKKQNQRKLWALWMLHDIQACAAFTSGYEELLYAWLDHFGISDSDITFHPYWEEHPAAKFSRCWWPKNGTAENSSKVYVSAYSKTGKALVVVVRDAPNNYSGNAVVEVELDRKKLGLPVGELVCTQLETFGRKVKGFVEEDTLIIPVGVDDFSAVVIEPRRPEHETMVKAYQSNRKKILSVRKFSDKMLLSLPARQIFKWGTSPEDLKQQWKGKEITIHKFADTPGNAYSIAIKKPQMIDSKEFIPVSPDKTYILSGYMKSNGKVKSKIFFGVKCYDKNKRYIATLNANPLPGAVMTKLTAAANAGDKKIMIKNAAGWKINKNNAIAFNAEADFSDLPNYELAFGVARISRKNGAYEVELTKKMNKGYPAGTKVREHYYKYGTFLYFGGIGTIPDKWVLKCSPKVTTAHDGKAGGDLLRPGTAFVKIIVIATTAQKDKPMELDLSGVNLKELK